MAVLWTMREFGTPRTLWADNEAMFRSRLWLNVLGALGVKQRHSLPRCPWQNGAIERLFLHCKMAITGIVFTSVDRLQLVLGNFQNFYNNIHRHTNLAGRTPMEAWHGMSLAEVQEQTRTCAGRWVQALNGKLVGYQLRIRYPIRR